MKTLPLRPYHPAPRFQLPADGGGCVALDDFRSRQQNLLLFLLHGPGCPYCAAIAREMVERRTDWERWETAALVVRSEAEPFPGLPRQAYDAGGEVRTRYGAPEGAIAVAALEHRGRFMDGWWLIHPEPVDWREIAETARWIAIQEPECSTCEIAPGWDEL